MLMDNEPDIGKDVLVKIGDRRCREVRLDSYTFFSRDTSSIIEHLVDCTSLFRYR